MTTWLYLPPWGLRTVALVGVFLVGLAIVRAARERGRVPLWRQAPALALRLAATAALVWVALNPTALQPREVPGKPHLGVLLDTSASMGTVDVDGRPRLVAASETLASGPVRAALETHFAPVVWPTVRRGTLTAAAVSGGAVLMWAAGLLFFGDVFRAVLPRLVDPAGDHPPYSRLRFAVAPGDGETVYGGQCEVEATAAGGPVERLFLVTRGAGGEGRSVMFRGPDGGFFQTLTNLRTPTAYWVTDGRARSRRFTIAVCKTPQIRQVTVRAAYPEHTGWKPRTLEWEEGEFRVPAGTRLEFRVASNRPLDHGTLAVTPVLGARQHTVTLVAEADPNTRVTGELEVTEAVALALDVTDTDGRRTAQPVRGRVTLIPDRRPRVTVLEPAARSLATPEAVLPVHVQAEDDFGIHRVLWFRGLNQSVERAAPIEADAVEQVTRLEGRTAFDMKDLGVRPGDRIAFFFEAVDNDPRGPNVGTTAAHTVEIISVEQYRDLLRGRQARQAAMREYAALDRRLRRLAERAEAVERLRQEMAEAGGETPEQRAALRKALQALRDALAEYREALQRLLDMPELFEVEEAFRASLRRSNPALQKAMEQLDEALGLPAGEVVSPEQLADLAQRLRRMAGRLKADVGDPARLLQSVVDLLARAQAFGRLASQQGELVRLLKRFRDPARPGVVQPWCAVACGGLDVVVTGVVDAACRPVGKGLSVDPARGALARLLPDLQRAGDVLVLLADLAEADVRALAGEFPEIALILFRGRGDSLAPERVNRTVIASVYGQARYVGDLELAWSSPADVTADGRAVLLDTDYPKSPTAERVREVSVAWYKEAVRGRTTTTCRPPWRRSTRC